MLQMRIPSAMAVIGLSLCGGATPVSDYPFPEAPDAPGVVTLETSDTSVQKNGGSSFTNGVHWSDRQIPEGNQKDYWVETGKKIYYPGGSGKWTFQGASLTMGGYLNAEASGYLTVNNLRLLEGGEIGFGSKPNALYGSVYVASSAESPAWIYFKRSGSRDVAVNHPTFDSLELSGTASSKLVFQWTDNGMRPQFSGVDLSRFLGTLRFEQSADLRARDVMTTNLWNLSSDLVVPGGFELGANTLQLRNVEFVIKTGRVKAEAASALKTSKSSAPFFSVSNRLELADGAVYDVKDAKFTQPNATTFDRADVNFFILSDEAAKVENLPDPGNLTLVGIPAESTGYNFYGPERLACFDRGDGTKVLAYRSGRPTHETVREGSADNGFVTNSANWADGVLPSSDENAVMCHDQQTDPGQEEVTFPCGGLVVRDGIRLYLNNPLTRIANLFLLGSASVRVSANPYGEETHLVHGMRDIRLVGGYIGVYGSDCSFSTYANRQLTIDAPLYGSGVLTLQANETGNYAYGGVELMRLNTNFTGRVKIDSPNHNSVSTSEDGYRTRVYVKDSRNLGGPMAAATFNGLTLMRDSILVGDNSLCIDQANRGVYIYTRARLVMTNEVSNTLEIKVPVTYNGELVFGNDYPSAKYAKTGRGSGSLVLSGPARFYDSEAKDDSGMPLAPSNRLRLAVGRVCPRAIDSLDGVTVICGAESEGIQVDYQGPVELRAAGFRNVKTSEPFESERPDGKVPVIVAGLTREDLTASGPVVPLMTVRTAVAESVATMLKPMTADGRRGKVKSPADNGDGTSTISADFTPQGCVILFR